MGEYANTHFGTYAKEADLNTGKSCARYSGPGKETGRFSL